MAANAAFRRPVAVVMNARSGARNPARLRAAVQRALTAARVDADVALATTGAELATLARRAAAGPAPIVVAAGGDGTMTAVAAEVLAADKTLGVLPLGTFNYFARRVRVPPDLHVASEIIAAGHAASVNVADVNGAMFLNSSSVGVYPVVLSRRRQLYSRWGRSRVMAYLSGALALLDHLPLVDVHLTTDRDELRCRTPLIFVANNAQQVAAFHLPGVACITDRFAVYVARHLDGVRMYWAAARFAAGARPGPDDVHLLCAREATVETSSPRLRVAVDGEVRVLATPLQYRLRTEALRVLTPAAP